MAGPAGRGRIPLRFVQVRLFPRKNLSTIYRKTPSIYRILSKFSDIIFAFFGFCASPGQLPYSCGRRHGFDFQNLHRNKKSFTLNLKTEKGKEIFFELAKNADVIVENYRPRVKERLGMIMRRSDGLTPSSSMKAYRVSGRRVRTPRDRGWVRERRGHGASGHIRANLRLICCAIHGRGSTGSGACSGPLRSRGAGSRKWRERASVRSLSRRFAPGGVPPAWRSCRAGNGLAGAAEGPWSRLSSGAPTGRRR